MSTVAPSRRPPPITDPSTLPPERVIGDVEAFLQTAVQQMPPDPAEQRRSPGRPRVLPSLCLWAGLLVCVLRGFTHQTDLWRLLTRGGFWSYPRFALTDEAVYKRLASGGLAPLEHLFAQVSALLAARLAPYAAPDLAPFATEVVALDEATLDAVARLLPSLRPLPLGADRLLPGKFAGLFDLRRQQWRRLHFIADVRQNEKVAARTLLPGLPPGSLILADLGFFAFAWFDELTDQHYWWISRLRAGTSYTVIHTFYAEGATRDCLIWLGAYRADRAAHAVRLVEFSVGSKHYRYITNVLDPAQLSLAQIAGLYARRWDIELAIKLVKQYLHLHLLWTAKDGVIQQQLWAVLIIAQILQALRLEIAGRAGVDPFDVSMELLVRYGPQYGAEGRDVVAEFVAHGRELGFLRRSSRTVNRAPKIDLSEICAAPTGLAVRRQARYAQRKNGPRPPQGGEVAAAAGVASNGRARPPPTQ